MSLELDSLFMRAFLFWGLIEREKARIEKNYEEAFRDIPSGMCKPTHESPLTFNGRLWDQIWHSNCTLSWPKWEFTSHWLASDTLPVFWKNLHQLTHANQSHHFSSRKFDPSMMPRCRPQNSEMSTQMPCWFESCRCNTLEYPAIPLFCSVLLVFTIL